MKTLLGYKRHLIHACRPLVRYVLLKQSPYYHGGKPGWFAAMVQGFKMLKKKPARLRVR
jgi:hypothetical protein